jgi:hypothetical protein
MPINDFDLQDLSHPVTHQIDMRTSFTNRKRRRRLPASRFQASSSSNPQAKLPCQADKASSLKPVRQQQQALTHLSATLEPDVLGDNSILPSIEPNETQEPIQEASDIDGICQSQFAPFCGLDNSDSQEEASLDEYGDQSDSRRDSLNTSLKDEGCLKILDPLPANAHAFAASLANPTQSITLVAEEDLDSGSDLVEFDRAIEYEDTMDFEEFASPANRLS